MLVRALKLQLTAGGTLVGTLEALVTQKWDVNVVNGQTVLTAAEAGGSVTFRAHAPRVVPRGSFVSRPVSETACYSGENRWRSSLPATGRGRTPVGASNRLAAGLAAAEGQRRTFGCGTIATPLILGFCAACKPADRRPPWQWCEEHVQVDETSPLPGRWRSDASPWVRAVMEDFSNNAVRDIAVQCAVQSAKTQTVMNCACWASLLTQYLDTYRAGGLARQAPRQTEVHRGWCRDPLGRVPTDPMALGCGQR